MNLRRQRPVPEPLPSPQQHLHEISLLDDHPTPYQLHAPRARPLHIDGWMQDEPPIPYPAYTRTPNPKTHPIPTHQLTLSKEFKPPKTFKPSPKPDSPRLHSSQTFRRARSHELDRQIRQELRGKQQGWQTHFHIRRTQGRSCAKIAEQFYLDHQKSQLQAVSYPINPANPERKRPLRPQVGRIRQLLQRRG